MWEIPTWGVRSKRPGSLCSDQFEAPLDGGLRVINQAMSRRTDEGTTTEAKPV
jgi:hypothetical protein